MTNLTNLQTVAKFIGKAVNDTIIDLGCCENHSLVSRNQIWELTDDDVNNVANEPGCTI